MSAEDKVRQKLQAGRNATYLLSAAEIAKNLTSFPETINSMKLSENFKQLLHLNGKLQPKSRGQQAFLKVYCLTG